MYMSLQNMIRNDLEHVAQVLFESECSSESNVEDEVAVIFTFCEL